MTEKEYQRDYQHRRRIASQIELARAKVAYLERKAERLGMAELLHPGRQA